MTLTVYERFIVLIGTYVDTDMDNLRTVIL